MPGRSGRSSGGGGYHHGGGARRVSGGKRGGSSGEEGVKPVAPIMITLHRRNDGSGGYSYRQETGVPWYNEYSKERRWEFALDKAKQNCPINPEDDFCQMYIELLVDCPPGTLEKHGLPPRLYPNSHIREPPLIIPDPCKQYRHWLQSCRSINTHFDAHWKCVPFEALVEDDCPSHKPKA